MITVHDGFTLHDLVSYNEKHNEANAEDNRDGESHNRSWNCGAEGPTDDPEILALRERQKRNFLTTLFASRGVPLLLGGDEMSRTQGGNNNAYCQDNPVSWLDWSAERRADPLLGFVQALIRLRRELPVLRHNEWLSGAGRRAGPARHRLVQRLGPADDAGGMGQPDGALRGRAARRPLRRASPPACCCCSTPRRESVTFTLPDEHGRARRMDTALDTAQGSFRTAEAALAAALTARRWPARNLPGAMRWPC